MQAFYSFTWYKEFSNRYNVLIAISNAMYNINFYISGIYNSDAIKAFVIESVIQTKMQ